jgi:hypothetical protein
MSLKAGLTSHKLYSDNFTSLFLKYAYVIGEIVFIVQFYRSIKF